MERKHKIRLSLFFVIMLVYISLSSFILAYGASGDPTIVPLRSLLGDETTDILHIFSAGVGTVGLSTQGNKQQQVQPQRTPKQTVQPKYGPGAAHKYDSAFGTKKLFHGADLESAKNISDRGLSKIEAMKIAPRHEGKFFTVDIEHREQAGIFAGQVPKGVEKAIVEIEIPQKLYEELSAKGLIYEQTLFATEREIIIKPEAFEFLNRYSSFRYVQK